MGTCFSQLSITKENTWNKLVREKYILTVSLESSCPWFFDLVAFGPVAWQHVVAEAFDRAKLLALLSHRGKGQGGLGSQAPLRAHPQQCEDSSSRSSTVSFLSALLLPSTVYMAVLKYSHELNKEIIVSPRWFLTWKREGNVWLKSRMNCFGKIISKSCLRTYLEGSAVWHPGK